MLRLVSSSSLKMTRTRTTSSWDWSSEIMKKFNFFLDPFSVLSPPSPSSPPLSSLFFSSLLPLLPLLLLSPPSSSPPSVPSHLSFLCSPGITLFTIQRPPLCFPPPPGSPLSLSLCQLLKRCDDILTNFGYLLHQPTHLLLGPYPGHTSLSVHTLATHISYSVQTGWSCSRTVQWHLWKIPFE
jgi:hypothetical protein